MKVLVVANTFPSASETFIELHVKSLLSRGHDVRLMAAPRAGSSHGVGADAEVWERFIPAPYPEPDGPRWKKIIRPMRLFLAGDWRSARLAAIVLGDYARGRTAGRALAAISYADALRRWRDWDVVHVHFGYTAISISQLCSAGLVNAPVVATFHGSDLNLTRKVPNRQLYSRVFRTAQLLTVSTRYMARRLEACHIPPEKLRIIPMGVDLSKFPLPDTSRAPKAGTRLATLGRLIECKGTEFAIRAVAAIKTQRPETPVSLDVIGDGPLRPSLEKLCADLGVSGNVVFHGALAHRKVLEVLASSDVYVHPGCMAADGTHEAQGLAVVEAQASAVPVVASRIGGIPEVVVENKTAYLVQPKNVPQLVDRIWALLDDDNLRRDMASAGRAFVQTHLDQSRLTDQWIAVYEQLARNQTTAPAR